MRTSNCLKCEHDIFDLLNWDSVSKDYIECPNCGNKMIVDYDYYWDDETGEEVGWWEVEQYEE